METSLPTPICQGQQVNLPEGISGISGDPPIFVRLAHPDIFTIPNLKKKLMFIY